MRITESENPDIVFICLSLNEAVALAEQLVSHVGEKQKPSNVIEKLTNQMSDLYLGEG